MNLGFRVTGKFVRELLDVLDEIAEEIRQEEKEKYPYAEWERKREIVKERLRNFLNTLERLFLRSELRKE